MTFVPIIIPVPEDQLSDYDDLSFSGVGALIATLIIVVSIPVSYIFARSLICIHEEGRCSEGINSHVTMETPCWSFPRDILRGTGFPGDPNRKEITK